MKTHATETEMVAIGDTTLKITRLADRQQFDDPEGEHEALGVPPAMWSLFGVIWEAGIQLAELMQEENLEGKRILELGCGLGIPSLICKRRGFDIVASDFHPLAGDFLELNCKQNDIDPIPWYRLDWRHPATEAGQFDCIIGSDLLYEREQPTLLAQAVGQYCKPGGEVILTDPGRKQVGRFSKLLAPLGFEDQVIKAGRYVRFIRSGINPS